MSKSNTHIPLSARAALSVKDAAVYVGVSRSSLYVLMKQGQLPSVRLGGRRLLVVSDLDALISNSQAR